MAEHKKRSRIVLIFAAGFIAAVIAFAIANDIAQRVTKSEFCGTTCHEMEGVYRGWKASGHYANDIGQL